MVQNLVFCLNATVPIFLLMVLGYLFKKVHIFTPELTNGMNSFVFKIALPVLVYEELATSDVKEMWDGGFILFCFIATFASILIGWAISHFYKDGSLHAEFIQGSYRSSAALLGVGIVTNLYGSAGMVPLMIIGAVPLYNIAAVVILTLGAKSNQGLTRELIGKTLLGVVKNPILIGIALGLIRAFLPFGLILPKTIAYVGGLATPLGLLALGASFEFGSAREKIGPTMLATFLKLIGFAMVWIPIAIELGFTQDKLVAILIMTGSPATVSCFVMAKNMGHEGTLSAGIVMLTTLLSAFTLTGWLYILRSLGLI